MKVVADGVHTAKSSKQNHLRGQKRERLALMAAEVWDEGECTIVQCTIQRVQPDPGHHCGSKRNKRYDSTSLLTDSRWFIYKYCTE